MCARRRWRARNFTPDCWLTALFERLCGGRGNGWKEASKPFLSARHGACCWSASRPDLARNFTPDCWLTALFERLCGGRGNGWKEASKPFLSARHGACCWSASRPGAEGPSASMIGAGNYWKRLPYRLCPSDARSDPAKSAECATED